MQLTHARRIRILEVGVAAAATIEKERPQVVGARKFRMATALGMRRLTSDGLMGGAVPALPPPVVEELDELDAALVDVISETAGMGVGLLADAIGINEGCACPPALVQAIRGLLQIAIEAGVRELRS